MDLSSEQEQIVELLRGIACATEQTSVREQLTGVFLPEAVGMSLPWKMIEEQAAVNDFGVGMPPLTQRYS